MSLADIGNAALEVHVRMYVLYQARSLIIQMGGAFSQNYCNILISVVKTGHKGIMTLYKIPSRKSAKRPRASVFYVILPECTCLNLLQYSIRCKYCC